jgi:hypothetical protein
MKVVGKNNPHFKSNTWFSLVLQFCLLITLDIQHSVSDPVTVPTGRNKNLTLLSFNLMTIHTCMQECMHTRTRTRVHTRAHMHAHAHMHTHTHTHTVWNTKNRLRDSYLECLYFCRVVQIRLYVVLPPNMAGYWLSCLCALHTSSRPQVARQNAYLNS